MRFKNSVMIGIIGMFCIGQIVSLKEVPPLLVDFIIHTHARFCPNITKSVLVMDSSTGTASLQEQILRKLNTSLVVLENSRFLNTMLLSQTCVIYFSYRYLINFQLTDAKLIVLIEAVDFEEQYPDESSRKLINFNTVFIVYNDTTYRSIRVDFPTRELIHNESLAAARANYEDLYHVEPHIAFTPRTESSSMQEFWRTITIRHNFTYVEPVEIHYILFGFVQAIQKLGFSMHRSISTYYILVPTNRLRPLGYLLIDPFDLATWICVLLTITTVFLLLWIVNRPHFNLSRTILELVQILINSPYERSRPAAHRFIITVFIVGSFILTSSYESLLTATIARPNFYPPLDNLDIINRSCNPMWKLDNFESDFNFIYESQTIGGVEITPGCFIGSLELVQLVHRISKKDPLYSHLLYEISPVEMAAFPVLGFLVSAHHQSLMELLRFYATAFAQAGLLPLVDGNGRRPDLLKPKGRQLKALSFGELLLIWKLAVYGWALSFTVFCAEVLWFYCKSFVKYLKGCCFRRD